MLSNINGHNFVLVESNLKTTYPAIVNGQKIITLIKI